MRIFLILIIVCFSLTLDAQVKQLDILELKFHQGHYSMVYRRANALLNKPEYDFSIMPSYYKAVTSILLVRHNNRFKRKRYLLIEANDIISKLIMEDDGIRIIKSHQEELNFIQSELQNWNNSYQTTNEVEILISTLNRILNLKRDQTSFNPEADSFELTYRDSIINEAKKYLGVKYKWAGSDPSGFDCSGFTSYVYKTSINKNLYRTANDQFENSIKKIKEEILPGDLVFFENENKISHVGIVYSVNNNGIEMIHASSSLGISIVNITTSTYWQKRISGFGSYF